MPDETEDTATDDTTPPEDPDGTEEDQPEGQKAMPRDQRMRLQRNEARAERDALAARVEALQTKELLRLAADHLANPADLLGLGDVTIGDLLDDDGNVDPDLVAEAAAGITTSRPGLAKDYRPVVGATDPSQGLGGRPQPRPPTFADMLRS